MNDHYIIVIGRQFGSGGRLIGKILSERLAIDYYDSALLKALLYRDEDIIRMFKTKVPVKVYKLRDDSFLKNLQKHLA